MSHLDTNIVVALLTGRLTSVRDRFDATRAAGTSMAVSMIVYHEVMYGAAHSRRHDANEEAIALFLTTRGLGLLPSTRATRARPPTSAPINVARAPRSAPMTYGPYHPGFRPEHMTLTRNLPSRLWQLMTSLKIQSRLPVPVAPAPARLNSLDARCTLKHRLPRHDHPLSITSRATPARPADRARSTGRAGAPCREAGSSWRHRWAPGRVSDAPR